jgi:hypothetical protein
MFNYNKVLGIGNIAKKIVTEDEVKKFILKKANNNNAVEMFINGFKNGTVKRIGTSFEFITYEG